MQGDRELHTVYVQYGRNLEGHLRTLPTPSVNTITLGGASTILYIF